MVEPISPGSDWDAFALTLKEYQRLQSPFLGEEIGVASCRVWAAVVIGVEWS